MIRTSSASISFIASFGIIIAITRSGGLKSPYRRIIFGMSISDIFQSLAILLGPFAVPASHSYGKWAIGNDFTCQADGFMLILGTVCTPIYMFALCLYTALKIKKNVSDAEFTKRFERIIHLSIIVTSLSLGIAGLVLKSINSTSIESLCTFAVLPSGCRSNPEVVGECDPEIEEHVTALQIICSFGIPVASLFGIICCMGAVCWQVRGTNRLNGSRDMSSLTALGSSKQDEDYGQEIKNQNVGSAYQFRKEIIIQACLFLLAFLVTNICRWFFIFTLLTSGNYPQLFIRIIGNILFPLGGVFNILVYTRPKIAGFRLRQPEVSWLRAFLIIVVAGIEASKPISDSEDAGVAEEGQGSVDASNRMQSLRKKCSGYEYNRCGKSSDENIANRNNFELDYDVGIASGLVDILEEPGEDAENHFDSSIAGSQITSRNNEIMLPSSRSRIDRTIYHAFEKANERIRALDDYKE